MNKKIGFIGLGKMATAIISGILASNFSSEVSILGYDVNEEVAKKLAQTCSISIYESVTKMVKECDIVFLSVKPFVVKDVLAETGAYITEKHTIISIVAGLSTDKIASFAGNKTGIIRVMPNTPALVKSGMSAVCANKNVSSEMVDFAKNLLGSIGEVVEVEEKLMDAVTALSGSGPAFYYYLINQFALSAQKEGLDYDKALKMSAQTALGAAKMILNTGETPQVLIKNVTTPGGTTEVGNNVLNQSDIPEIFDEVISKTAQKSKDLGKA